MLIFSQEFSYNLASLEACFDFFMTNRNKGTWMRGIVLERVPTGDLSIYLPDTGHQISSPEKEIGLVVSAIDKFPACALQVRKVFCYFDVLREIDPLELYLSAKNA